LPTPEDAGSTTSDSGPAVTDAYRPPIDAGAYVGDVLIYAHSRDTLFTFSPDTTTVTRIGTFTQSGGGVAPEMLDLAVDAEGVVLTCSQDSLFEVDPETATVTRIGDFDEAGEVFFALTFLAPGQYSADETLVGATNEGAYYVVDRTTARTTYLGSYPDGWQSSGDIVSIEGLGTFATARRSDYAGDVLIQIIFASDGSSTAVFRGPVTDGSENFRQLFGLGYWGRELFGFSNAGELIRIDRDTGEGEIVTAATGTDEFWGAGVTTKAFVIF
jgi:hypothetical protein